MVDITTPHGVKEPGKPVASLILGVIGLIAWIIPVVGLPVTITGLVFGINSLRRVQKGVAIAGIVLCSIGLFFSAINCAWGAYLGATGKHALVNKIQNNIKPQKSHEGKTNSIRSDESPDSAEK